MLEQKLVSVAHDVRFVVREHIEALLCGGWRVVSVTACGAGAAGGAVSSYSVAYVAFVVLERERPEDTGGPS